MKSWPLQAERFFALSKPLRLLGKGFVWTHVTLMILLSSAPHRFYETACWVIFPSQNLIFLCQEILPNSEYASSSPLNLFKSEGGQEFFRMFLIVWVGPACLVYLVSQVSESYKSSKKSSQPFALLGNCLKTYGRMSKLSKWDQVALIITREAKD